MSGIEEQDLDELTLTDGDVTIVADWAASLFTLGGTLRALARPCTKLTVALSLPALDMVAVCIAAGWRITGSTSSPVSDLREIPEGTPVRLLAGRNVIGDRFFGISPDARRMHVGKSKWQLGPHTEIFVAADLTSERFGRAAIPESGAVARRYLSPAEWRRFHTGGAPDLKIIGTKTRLLAECDFRVGVPGVPGTDEFGALIQPDDGRGCVWSCEIEAAATMDKLPQSKPGTMQILEGGTAIRWLPESNADVTVCLVDRSAADESAADTITQTRATSVPVTPEELGWTPPAAIEALAFKRETS